ncbi:hypothetical protein [Micromonospora sp. CB01531]|uniref:hypothetical protein n=1 Tax=Micromonospora sp. CB01531 TaxID=1718947 RepID=UPI000938B8B1|nr:hypothetical protein [Micromonospora sp. CB01531]OKI45477.1 hypothetical protein A6A27_38155 [Micromonospora sp. CB01531]
MTEPTATSQAPPTLEFVLRHAWDAFHPGQPAPLGWLTHTTTQIQAYVDEHHTDPQTQPPTVPAESLPQLRSRVWHALRDAVISHDIDVDAANHILDAVDLPLLPRRWQVRLTLTVVTEVTATCREDAFDTAETAVETALTGAELEARIEWDGRERDNADPGELDTTAAEYPGPDQ